ncbi:aminotransferase class IV [Salinisphaera orenii]|uniref:aminotransferase class IV n=1 Tax=Salinisphaera orenii TaxID=856731 RepID=UPI000DBE7F9A
MTDTALINGSFVAAEQASISIFDRGFLFADSVYEVVPVYAGRPFRLEAHLSRLADSLAAVGIDNPHQHGDWVRLLNDLINVNGGGDQSVYLQVTRGAPARREHRLPQDVDPNIVAFCQARRPPPPATLADGVAAVTRRDTRWARCHIKSTSLLANVLAAAEAHAEEATEALFIDEADGVVEGSSSNIFAVVDGRVLTPALRPAILPGITRGVVLDVLAANDIAHHMVDHLPLTALRRADEIWICSSSREIMPVTQLDGVTVGNGRPGDVWAKVYGALQEVDHE